MDDVVTEERDLLRKAAIVAGYEPVRVAHDGRALILFGVHVPWNPLCRDADAFRLATTVPGIDVTQILLEAFSQYPSDEAKRAEHARRAITVAVAARTARLGRGSQREHRP